MTISMQNLEKLTLAEMEEFVDGSRKLTLSVEGEGAIYGFIECPEGHARGRNGEVSSATRRWAPRL
jgi:hypothetical protein